MYVCMSMYVYMHVSTHVCVCVRMRGKGYLVECQGILFLNGNWNDAKQFLIQR